MCWSFRRCGIRWRAEAVPIPLGNNAPRGPVRALESHTVTETRERDLATLKNGELLSVAERAGFDVL